MDSQHATTLNEKQRLFGLLQYAFARSGKIVNRKITIYCPIKSYFVDWIDTFGELGRRYLDSTCTELLYKNFMADINEDIKSIRNRISPGARMSDMRYASMCNNNNTGLYSAFYTLKHLLLPSIFPHDTAKQENLKILVTDIMDILYFTQDISSLQSVYLRMNPVMFQVLVYTCEDRAKFIKEISLYFGYNMEYKSKISRYYARRKRIFKESILFNNLLLNS